MIDIVVTYLNPKDEQWQKEFKYWKEKEIKDGRAEENNRQAFGVERIREWDNLKYWFRCIENNCKWINKVFLVVQNERHVPKWINQNNPKLRIVYHEEFIPKELLPTFNAMTIGMYLSNIKDLSEQYIMSDDDYFILNPINKERFFRYNKPVHLDNRIEYKKYGGQLLKGSDRVFYHILNNNFEFEKKFTKDIKYGIYHLPEARLKSFEQKILKDYGEEILNHQNKSRFRNKSNLCSYLYSDLLKITNNAILDNPYKRCRYCTLKSDVDFYRYFKKDIVCFNDTEQMDNFERAKKRLNKFFEGKFPNKSSFEI